ncbi:ATP-binding cassette domain-containing protein [Corallococcus sp. NCSPR001]|uniref:ATP-binding cassette domain-containing protein n=1 Tax=Corallococcus sp. NCRR TaxID=2996782 RepID=UPI001A8E9BEB|nr:ATP-binding cassette domain-containing protein [Corallococcus sp. NCSPR001]
MGLLGANGAGKTTLLGALTGTVRGTTGGSVRLDVGGCTPAAPSGSRRKPSRSIPCSRWRRTSGT